MYENLRNLWLVCFYLENSLLELREICLLQVSSQSHLDLVATRSRITQSPIKCHKCFLKRPSKNPQLLLLLTADKSFVSLKEIFIYEFSPKINKDFAVKWCKDRSSSIQNLRCCLKTSYSHVNKQLPSCIYIYICFSQISSPQLILV